MSVTLASKAQRAERQVKCSVVTRSCLHTRLMQDKSGARSKAIAIQVEQSPVSWLYSCGSTINMNIVSSLVISRRRTHWYYHYTPSITDHINHHHHHSFFDQTAAVVVDYHKLSFLAPSYPSNAYLLPMRYLLSAAQGNQRPLPLWQDRAC